MVSVDGSDGALIKATPAHGLAPTTTLAPAWKGTPVVDHIRSGHILTL
jgi:hypothetical protein